MMAENCPICLEELLEATIPCLLVPCGHTFCSECCDKLFKENEEVSCPLCRQISEGFTEQQKIPKIPKILKIE
jgi:hypothetical protein